MRTFSRRTFSRHLSAVLVLLALCALPRSADAAPIIWVGDSNPASCIESALRDALAYAALNGGRTIKFNCGRFPVIITLTSTLTVPNNTTINGGGTITLSGPVIGYLVVVAHQSSAVLQNLTITNVAGHNGSFTTQGFGVLNEGTLTVKGSNLSGNDGGAISNEGVLTVRDSTISHNGFLNHSLCVGIDSNGTLTVSNSAFEGNVGGGAAAVCNSGVATIQNSSFSKNFSDQVGGAIFTQGTLTVNNSTFSGNSATFFGGAIFKFGGNLTVNNSTFVDNHVVDGGGAIAGSSVTINNSVFHGNSSSHIGGALVGDFVIKNSEFSNNSADLGGAFHGQGIITNSSFTNNSAAFQGGAIRVFGDLTIRNSIITGNAAGEAGGGIYICCEVPPIASNARIVNTLVIGNTPDNTAP